MKIITTTYFMKMLHLMVLYHRLLSLLDYQTPVTRSLIIYLQIRLVRKHQNCVLSNVISDHQMTCCILPQNKTQQNKKIYIEVELISEKTLENLKDELNKIKLCEKINHDIQSNPNESYNILSDILCDVKQRCIPKKTRKYNKRKDKKEKWMTDKLLTEVNQKNDMYVDWKSNSVTAEIYDIKKLILKHLKE